MRWNLTNALMLDYNARTNAIVDEPFGSIDSDFKRDSVLNNLYQLGRMKHFDQNIGATYRLPFDKFPFTNWLSAETRYEATYTWSAGSIDQIEQFGNSIQNGRNYQLTGKVDLLRLYNKVGFLKKINDASQQQKRPQPTRPGQRPKEDDKQEEEAASVAGAGFINGFGRLLMSVRSVNLNYSRTQGTLLPGFRPRAFLFGLDSTFAAPGLPFLLGSQDPSIRHLATDNNWMVESTQLTTPFTQTGTENIDIRAEVQPLNDFRILIDLKKNKTSNYQEIFRFDSLTNDFVSLTPARSGSYSISFLPIATAFDRKLDNNGSEAFERFAEYRNTIKERLQSIESQNEGVFDLRSQDVLVPAFLAAYSGKDPNKVKLSPFPQFPLPNWRIDYAGLSKIPALKEIFSAITLSHSYVSRYSVNNYTNSLRYTGSQLLTLDNSIERYSSADNVLVNSENGGNQLVPLYVAGQVVLTEQFAPLIGINVRTKTRFNAQLAYNKERNLALNLSNTQLTEQNTQDVRLDVGYTTSNLKLPFRMRGREVILKNEVTFRMGMSLRNTRMIQRRFDESDEITNGSVNFQLNPTIDYWINQRLNIQLYYSTNVNNPLVLTSFPNTTTRFGTQIRFNITQ